MNLQNGYGRRCRRAGGIRLSWRGRSQTTTALISRMLSGERRPGAWVARRLACALHLAPEEIFRRAGLLPRTLPQPPGLEELVHLYGELSDEDRQRLIMIARSFRSLTHGK